MKLHRKLFGGVILAALMFLGIGLSLSGVVWLSLSGQSGGDAPNPALGNLLELGAMHFKASARVLASWPGP